MEIYKNSNTTLVKVKYYQDVNSELELINSNTTLVKVKSIANRQNLKKPLNSNTTLVKVKFELSRVGARLWKQFKYNTC